MNKQITEEQEDQKEDVSPMEDLLKKESVPTPEIGDVLEGVVIEKTSNSLLIDLGILGTGIVYGAELRDGMGIVSALAPGDKIKAVLVDAENEDGFVELSVRQASYARAWEDIEEKMKRGESFSVKISDANRGGLMTEINGVGGFLPVSQLSGANYPRVENGDKNRILELLKKLVGRELTVRVIDCDREATKLIVSEKAAGSEKERLTISELSVGDTIEGEVSGVVDFGAFVKFLPPSKKDGGRPEDRLEGLVHISELAWQLIDDPREVIKTGDAVKAKIIGVDDMRISLSIKALKDDPWRSVGERYKVGDEVPGKVDKVNPFGAFVYLDKDIHGLAHISEFRNTYPGKSMEEVVQSGETYKWKILSIEPRDHRMGLSLVKQKAKSDKQ